LFFLLLLVAMPASRQWVNYFIGVWALSSLLNIRAFKQLSLKDFTIVLILGSISLLGLISLLYTENLHIGFIKLQKQIPLLVLPFFMILNRVERYSVNNSIIAYLFGNLILSAYLIVQIFSQNDLTEYINYGFSLTRFLDWTHAISSLYNHPIYISLHLSLGIILSIYLITNCDKNRMKKLFLVLYSGILLTTLIFVGARSAVVVVLLSIIYYTVVLFRRRIIIFGASLIILTIVFSAFVIGNSRFIKNLNIIKYQFIEVPVGNNLIYNGDFSKNAKFWGYISPDSITHEIIETPEGNALRVSCVEGSRYWPLAYKGRAIQYYSGATYTFNFKYRVIKGSRIPFRVGWGAKDGQVFISNLEKTVEPLESGWAECTAKYVFEENQQNIVTFINYMEPNSVVDFSNITLRVDDPLQRDSFIDQIEDIRIQVWKAAFLALKRSPLVGYGIGDIKETLLGIYSERDIHEAYDNRHNAHNQFLELGLQSGFLGIVLLCTIIGIMTKAMKNKKFGLIIGPFLIIIVINFLIESTLLRLNGVIFFGFWFSYLWILAYRIREPGIGK